MKKAKFTLIVCIVLCLTFLLPFASSAASGTDTTFVAPDYKEYNAGTESNLVFHLDYTEYEWFGFHIEDTSTGEVYYSNPTHENSGTSSASTERQKTENSQLVLQYNYDSNGNQDALADVGYVSSAAKVGTFYSYDDCVVRDQLEITEIVEDGVVVGVKVIYGLGVINSELYPKVITADSMDKYCALLVDENGNPDESAQKKFRGRYALLSLETIEEDRQKALKKAKTEAAKADVNAEWDETLEDYLLEYPILADGTAIYVIYSDSTANTYKKNQLIDGWAQVGLTREDLDAEYKLIGYAGSGSGVTFYIPVIYKIEGNTFKVQIVTDEIEEAAEVAITKIDILPMFGSMRDEDVESGYSFLPDGSGAVIEYGSGDTRTSSVQIALSSRHKDEGLSRTGNNISSIPYFEQSILPVFGMKEDDRAVFAVIEKGYELCNVAAYMAEGAQNQYNYMYTSCYLTATDDIYYSDGSSAGLTMYPKVTVEEEKVDKKTGEVSLITRNYCRLPDTDIQIRFTFLYDEAASYSGMANWFRQYLIDLYGMERLEATENTTLYADYYGAILKKVSILGFPIQMKYALTDFDEAIEITEALLENVDSLSVRYMGMANGALYATDYSNDFNPLRCLGGSSGYKEFLTKMSELGVNVSPDLNPTHVYKDKSFEGFMPYYDAVRTLGKSTNIIQNHNLATGLYATATGEDEAYYFPRWVVTPSLYDETFTSLKEDLANYDNMYISFSELGSTLSADYDEDMIIDRTQTSRVVSSILEDYQDSGYKVTVDKGNYWTIPYVDTIRSIPTTSSQYLIEDYEIPFVEMVLHGLVNYAGEDINTVQNTNYQILKCLEYGCSLSARLMYEEDITLQNTYYTTVLYSLNYENWIDQIGEMYNTVNDVLKGTQDQFLVAHERLAVNVYVSTYENGLQIMVNYNDFDETVEFNGETVTIAANGFIVLEEGN